MKSGINIILLLLAFLELVNAQQSEKIIVTGDSLRGRRYGGQQVREVIGNVVLRQGDVVINCDKAIQYYATNMAELIGNVVITQDTLKLYTDRGYYYGNEKRARSVSDVWLTDGVITLRADKGEYFTENNEAYFRGNVRYEAEGRKLDSDFLRYFKDIEKIIAWGNARLADSASIMTTDSLEHFRNVKKSYAYDNVLITEIKSGMKIRGDYLENRQSEQYSKITGYPLLTRTDTSRTGKIDTLVMRSEIMESFRDSINMLIASGNVKIRRGDFVSVNEKTTLFRNENRILTTRPENSETPPVIWNENTQVSGDTINIYMYKNRIDSIMITGNSFMLSGNPEYPSRYDQISGDITTLFFGEEGLRLTRVEGSVLSIYYFYEENEPNGLLKSSSEKTYIFIKDSKVADVKLYGKPNTEYHPENLVEGNEKGFTLPSFIIYENKPGREEILSGVKK